MSYTAIYRKYRPSTFDEVAGQQHVVTTLKNALEQNRLAHAYLFSGPSGNGKTSIAKLFAKAINCESETEIICDKCSNCLDTKNNTHPDLVEIDAASNNGVDEIRSLIEKVKYAPLNGKYRIYIIDEVHMLSLGAFNALLKTLEEPPAHVVFILATTEPHKVIPTIISRCQRYDFTRVKEKDIYDNIVQILEKENIQYETEAIQLISQLADGGVRESLSILEQAIAFSGTKIETTDVRKIYGIVTKEEKLLLLNLILNQEMEQTLNLLNEITDQGNNLERLNLDLINYLKECVIYGYSKSTDLLNYLDEADVIEIINKTNATTLLSMIDILMEIASYKKTISDLHAYLELGFIKMINLSSPQTKDVREIPVVNNAGISQTIVEDREPKQVQSSSAEEERKVEPTVEEILIQNVPQNEAEQVVEEASTTVKDEVTDTESTIEEVVQEEILIEDDIIVEEDIVTEILDEEASFDVEEELELEELIDDEFLLSLLANANKEKRLVMDDKWKSISSFGSDVKYAKYAHQLKDSALVAVGDNYALVSVSNEMFANSINDLSNQAGLSEFIKDKLYEELRVFAISVDEGNSLIQSFRERAAQGSLPELVNVQIIKSNESSSKVETLEDKAQKLFGEDGFIIEE